jgi:DNA-binding XRE family transcriptional regulator
MPRNFRELEAKMSPARREKVQAKTRELLHEMLLSEVRKEAGLTQETVAKDLGIKQPTLSRLESQDDMQISTLSRLVKALGGKLEIIAHLPSGDVRLGQFVD